MLRVKPTISIIHDTRNKKATTWPVKLRANFQLIKNGKRLWEDKYYPLDGQKYTHASVKDFEAAKGGKVRSEVQRVLRDAMITAEKKATQILDNHTFVSIDTFERFFTYQGNLNTVGDVFNIMIKEALTEGSRLAYISARNSFARFVNPLIPEFKPSRERKEPWHCEINISFYEITEEWLRRYRAWMIARGRGKTVISIHFRHLRAVFNKAIDLHIAKHDIYPFGRKGFKIQKTAARKKKLDEHEKNMLLLEKSPELQFSIDYWLLSYYSFGINMMDIALLRFKDIKDDIIEIQRAKTVNTESQGRMLIIPIRQEVNDIILRRGNKSLNPNDYVFPILREGMTPAQIKRRVNYFANRVNKGLEKVRDKLGLKYLKHGMARHSFSNIALEKGASKEFIQDALGHATMTTTEEYLDSFTVKTKRAISSKL